MKVIKELIKIANELDDRGATTEADILDEVLKGFEVEGFNPSSSSDQNSTSDTGPKAPQRSKVNYRLKQAQEKLLEYGYHMDAGADGLYGPQTKAAIEEFQLTNELSVTGVLSDSDYDLLLNGSPIKASKKRLIIALGDSITAGGYARELQRLIPGSRTNSMGYGGKQTGFIKRKLDEALSKSPSDIIILAGVNDIASGKGTDHIVTNLKEMYEKVRRAGVRIVAVQILPWHGRRSADGRHDITHEVNSWIKSYINSLPEEEGHRVIVPIAMYSDDPSKYEINREFSGDRIHPNKKGKEMLARMIAEQGFDRPGEQDDSLYELDILRRIA
tara:strand:+ start:2309 stop:3298 length:990 start_codon:yes stop_codon:yes gene_type:complete